MPPDFDGGPTSLETLRQNIAMANIVGTLVGSDMRSSMIVVPLQSATGAKDFD